MGELGDQSGPEQHLHSHVGPWDTSKPGVLPRFGDGRDMGEETGEGGDMMVVLTHKKEVFLMSYQPGHPEEHI